jgi:hypothetical protein
MTDSDTPKPPSKEKFPFLATLTDDEKRTIEFALEWFDENHQRRTRKDQSFRRRP